MKISADAIHFHNLAEFSQFARLIGHEIKMLRSENSIMVLANDIYNDKKAMLSPANTKVDAELFRKLRTSVSDKLSSQLNIDIKKCPEIAEKLLKLIRSAIRLQLENADILSRVGKTLFLRYEDRLMNLVNQVFENTQLVYAFFGENSILLYNNQEFKGFDQSILESIVKALMSVGTEIDEISSEDYTLLQLLFITQIVISLTKNDIKNNLAANATSADYDLLVNTFLESCLNDLGISNDIILAGKSFFHTSDLNGDAELMTETALKLIRNIEVIEEFYRLISSNEAGYINVNNAITILYKKCYHNELDENTLQKLSTWLQKPAIFRLNKTLYGVEELCKRGKNGKSNAIYYPKHGYGVPTMFICSVNDGTCPHISPAFRRINVTKRLEGLSPGSYTKCSYLTETLHKYYEKDLTNIKRDQNKMA
ncbi:MAG: hypothetical protein H6696_03180 [Deferribacteres bacterium]|nr:hypothetical protein [candidate division KSB1 bacterium]MCB9500919.1 hypothetical protein [Deferribacteres bacterium]